MNLGSASVVLRPRTTRESFDLAIVFMIKVGGLPYLWFCVASLAPAIALCAGLWLWLDWSEAHVWMLAVPLGLCLQGLFTVATGQLMFSPQLDARAVLRFFLRRSHAYFWGLLLTRAAVLLLAWTLVLGLWAWSRLLFVPEMLLLEGLTVGTAIERSNRLGRSREGLEVSLWTLGAVAYFVLAGELLGDSVVHFLLQVPKAAESEAAPITSVYGLIAWFSSLPLLATVRFLRYVDGRTRSDGWDAQVKLQRMAQANAEPA